MYSEYLYTYLFEYIFLIQSKSIQVFFIQKCKYLRNKQMHDIQFFTPQNSIDKIANEKIVKH